MISLHVLSAVAETLCCLSFQKSVVAYYFSLCFLLAAVTMIINILAFLFVLVVLLYVYQ